MITHVMLRRSCCGMLLLHPARSRADQPHQGCAALCRAHSRGGCWPLGFSTARGQNPGAVLQRKLTDIGYTGMHNMCFPSLFCV